MKNHDDSMQKNKWIPLWIDKWIFGATRTELCPDERAVWIDLMAIAAKDNGHIRANPTTPYSTQQLAGFLCITEELLLRTLQRCLETNKIEEIFIDRQKEEFFAGYRIINWAKYQLSKRYKRKFEIAKLETASSSGNPELCSGKAELCSGKAELCSGKAELLALCPLSEQYKRKFEIAKLETASGSGGKVAFFSILREKKRREEKKSEEKKSEEKKSNIEEKKREEKKREENILGEIGKKYRNGSGKTETLALSLRFIKPAIQEIINYCQKRKNNINPQIFFNFYESKNWMIGKNKMKNWQAAIRTWEQLDRSGKQLRNDTEIIRKRTEVEITPKPTDNEIKKNQEKIKELIHSLNHKMPGEEK